MAMRGKLRLDLAVTARSVGAGRVRAVQHLAGLGNAWLTRQGGQVHGGTRQGAAVLETRAEEATRQGVTWLSWIGQERLGRARAGGARPGAAVMAS